MVFNFYKEWQQEKAELEFVNTTKRLEQSLKHKQELNELEENFLKKEEDLKTQIATLTSQIDEMRRNHARELEASLMREVERREELEESRRLVDELREQNGRLKALVQEWVGRQVRYS